MQMSLPYHLRVRSTPAIPRGQARRALALTTLAVASLASWCAPGAGAETVERCVERNTVRYSEPANSALGQYFDLEAACRSAIEGDAETGFTLTPEASGPEGAAAETPGPPSRAPAAPGGASGEDAPGGANGQDGAPAAPVREPDGPGPPGQAAGGADDASASPPPASAERGGPPLAENGLPDRAVVGRPVAGVPYWVIAIVGLAIAAAIAMAVRDSRARHGSGAGDG